MREALAHSDHDFVLSEPAPRSRKPQPRRGIVGTLGALFRFAYRLAAYPNRIGGILIFGLAVAIMINALMLQQSRHPAPLFRKSIILPIRAAPAHAPREPRPAVGVPEAARPRRDPIGQLLKSETPAPQQAGAAAPTNLHRHMNEHAAQTAAKPAADDPISQILKLDRPQPSPGAESPRVVLAVQRALVKLGFVLRADGQMGAVTRHAIEQYERDHGLPVHAELTPKFLHRLAAESGVGIE